METNKIILGDCIEEMKKIPDCSVDSIITDPPYDLTSINKRFGKENSAPAQYGKDGSFSRLSKGFMGKTWDGTGIAFKTETWKECLRILKHGGHLLSFGGTRTYHKMVTAIEEAGFEIRDMIEWIYGSGFPKSLNIGKKIDELQGNERTIIGESWNAPDLKDVGNKSKQNIGINKLSFGQVRDCERKKLEITKGNTEWEGVGTALKPSHEPIVLARKPLSEKSITEQVLKTGTGGLNIEESRIECNHIIDQKQNRIMIATANGFEKGWGMKPQGKTQVLNLETGRYPANLIHDGSVEVMKEFPDVEEECLKDNYKQKTLFDETIEKNIINSSRFFYCAKASKEEREWGLESLQKKNKIYNGKSNESSKEMKGVEKKFTTKPSKNIHPTVKPIALMKYLIRLITPKGGIVLDPFAGSGTTLIAATKLNYEFIGIEKEEEYYEIAKEKIKKALEQTKLNGE